MPQRKAAEQHDVLGGYTESKDTRIVSQGSARTCFSKQQCTCTKYAESAGQSNKESHNNFVVFKQLQTGHPGSAATTAAHELLLVLLLFTNGRRFVRLAPPHISIQGGSFNKKLMHLKST